MSIIIIQTPFKAKFYFKNKMIRDKMYPNIFSTQRVIHYIIKSEKYSHISINGFYSYKVRTAANIYVV